MNKKKVSINFAYQSAYQILLIITPLITAPYIARVLGPNNNGIYTYSFSVVTYFVVFASLGIEAYGNRIIAQAKTKGRNELDRTFSSLFWMHFIVGALVTVIYFFYAVFFAGENKVIALVQGIWVIGALIDINWLFFGLEEFKLTVIRNFIVKLLTVLSVFVFVKSDEDLWIYAAVTGMGTLISNAILWVFVNKHVHFTKVSLQEVFIHVKPLFVLFLAVIATSIYRLIDKIMLGWYSDMSNLAAYEYADKMIKLVITLITALGTVMLPRMSALYSEGKNEQAAKYLNSSAQFMFVMAFALAFGLAGISDEFMPLFLGEGYEGAVLLTKVLCISLPIMGWNNLVRTQVLIPKEKDKVYTIAVWVGAIVNIVLNLIFINLYGPIGAAIATVVAYAVVGFFQSWPIMKEIPVFAYLKHAIIPFLSGAIMYACVRFFGGIIESAFLGVVVEITVGALVYMTINIVYLKYTKNEVLEGLLKRIHKKTVTERKES